MNMSLNVPVGNSSVIGIDIGSPTSTTLGGVLDVTNFPNIATILTAAGGGGGTGSGLSAIRGYENKKITEFRTRYNSLTGNLPDFTGTLSSMSNFNVQNNRFTGGLPTLSALAAAGTPNLQFQVQHNYLTGGVPADLSNLSNLKTLSIAYNIFTGSLPVLTGCSSLRTFEANYNCGVDSESVYNSTNYFPYGGNSSTIYNNGLTGGIPAFGTANSALQSYVVHSCNLNGSIPPLTALTNLTNFECHNQGPGATLAATLNTGLTGTIPDLSRCTALQTFNCNSNKLSGVIPDLSPLPALVSFICNNNTLTGVTLASIPLTLNNFDATNNYFTLTGTWYCLSAFYTKALYNPTFSTGYIGLSGSKMPALQTSTQGPINSAINTYVRYLTSSPRSWTVTLGNSAIAG